MTAARIGARPRNQIALGTSLTVAATFVMAIPAGGAVLPIAAYTLSGLGMGIASPALFAAVLADGAEGREGRSTSSIPLARQVGSGMGAAVAGIVFAATLTSAQVSAAERAGAHVPAVIDAARLTYLAAALGRAARRRGVPVAAQRRPDGPGRARRWSSPRPWRRPACRPLGPGGLRHCLRWARSRQTSPPICGGSSGTPASGRGSARPSRRSWPAATCSRSCRPARASRSATSCLRSLAPGVTLVVSPLIALMQDQYGALRNRGIDGVEMLTSAMSQDAVAAAVERIRDRLGAAGLRRAGAVHERALPRRDRRGRRRPPRRRRGALPLGVGARLPPRLPAARRRPRAARLAADDRAHGDGHAARCRRHRGGAPAQRPGHAADGVRPPEPDVRRRPRRRATATSRVC